MFGISKHSRNVGGIGSLSFINDLMSDHSDHHHPFGSIPMDLNPS